MKLLEIEHLKKSFGGIEVLSDLSMSVSEGEVVAVLGPSGSGKSTMLRCASLLETMDAGALRYAGSTVAEDVDGRSVYVGKKEQRELKSIFGLVFQNFNLFPHYTVLKNIIDAPVHVQKRDKEEVVQEARALLKKGGLEDKEDAYPCQLSGGQQPTSALDPEITAGILRILRQLAEEKMTMIIVTHEIDFARKVADRVVFMDGGVVVEQGRPEDVIDHPQNERTKMFLQKMEV